MALHHDLLHRFAGRRWPDSAGRAGRFYSRVTQMMPRWHGATSDQPNPRSRGNNHQYGAERQTAWEVRIISFLARTAAGTNWDRATADNRAAVPATRGIAESATCAGQPETTYFIVLYRDRSVASTSLPSSYHRPAGTGCESALMVSITEIDASFFI